MTDMDVENLKAVMGSVIETLADTRRRLTNLTMAVIAMKEAVSESDLPKLEAAYQRDHAELAADKFSHLETPTLQSLLREAEKFRQSPLVVGK